MIVDCITRFLRRKLVLGVVFCLSLCYCLYSFSKDFHRNLDYTTKDMTPITPTVDPKSFMWNSEEAKNTSTSVPQHTCRNSVQGKYLMADDKGYTCKRTDVTGNGCCDVNAVSTKRYSCDTCKKDGCCGIYEYCISCCLHPNKRPILESVLLAAQSSLRVILSSVNDQFELCLAKCRTNSHSVYHENLYRAPAAKYCYG